MSHFANKVVIVTGAASGMGESLAKKLCAAGATVVATDVNERGLEALARSTPGPGNLITQKQDVRNREAFNGLVREVVAEHGHLDILFNNAGIAIAGEVANNTWDDWQRTIDINILGVSYGTLAAYEVMRSQGHGHIVNTASVAGLMPAPLLTAYSMSKHAVLGMSLALREEAKGYGVKVSVVCPGIVRTNIVNDENLRGVDMEGDPFAFLEKKAKIKAISADKAADFILKGVEKNLPEIIFPLHGKMMVQAYRNGRKFWEIVNTFGLKEMRKGNLT